MSSAEHALARGEIPRWLGSSLRKLASFLSQHLSWLADKSRQTTL